LRQLESAPVRLNRPRNSHKLPLMSSLESRRERVSEREQPGNAEPAVPRSEAFVEQVVALQRSAGNAAVSRMLVNARRVQRQAPQPAAQAATPDAAPAPPNIMLPGSPSALMAMLPAQGGQPGAAQTPPAVMAPGSPSALTAMLPAQPGAAPPPASIMMPGSPSALEAMLPAQGAQPGAAPAPADAPVLPVPSAPLLAP
jgi:hypothetical protein